MPTRGHRSFRTRHQLGQSSAFTNNSAATYLTGGLISAGGVIVSIPCTQTSRSRTDSPLARRIEGGDTSAPMSQITTRKRPAPIPQFGDDTRTDMASPNQDTSFGWQNSGMSGPDSPYANESGYNTYNGMQMAQQSQNSYPSSSNQIVRRAPNQNMIPASDYINTSEGNWNNGVQMPTQDSWQTPYDDLNQRAEVAKRDAQTKRKQIPPFIQKLSR